MNKNTVEKVTKPGSPTRNERFKELVLSQVKKYYLEVHKPGQDAEFLPGKSKVNYASRVYDEKELVNLVDSALEFYLTAGRYDLQFCRGLSAYLQSEQVQGIKVLTCNSGSSANLIAISALISPRLGELALKKGDEVITVAAGFPTTVTPVVQNQLVPVFIDVEPGTYNIDAGKIEKAMSKRTKAIFLAHTLGIPFNVDKVLEVAERYRLWIIEDNCDALGAEYNLAREYDLIKDKKVSGKLKTGTIGHIGTSSFYPAHQMTMGEGGAVYTSDGDLYRIAISLRDWGRDCWCQPGSDNTCKKRFEQQLGLLPYGYDHKYTYSHLGYNLKITDIQAAIGVAQLKKLPDFVKARYDNWKLLRRGLEDLDEVFVLPIHPDNSIPSPFGFALTLKEGANDSCADVTRYLEENNIQTRRIFSGNMLRQPAFTESDIQIRIGDSPIISSNKLTEADFERLKNTEIVMNNTFWVGVYPGLKPEMIKYMISKIRESVGC